MNDTTKFRDLTPEARRRRLIQDGGADAELAALLREGGLTDAESDRLVENAVGIFGMPLGMATGQLVNGRKYTVPMVVEEPSVVAAQSSLAQLVARNGGFRSVASAPIMAAQVQLLGIDDPEAATARIEASGDRIARVADERMSRLVGRGGGFRGLEVRSVPHPGDGEIFFVVHLHVDVRDAMGANLLNTLAEDVAPMLAEVAGGAPGLKILSNLSDRRTVTTECRLSESSLAWRGYSGTAVADGLILASRFAEADPYRAATHNKGILNGVDALMLATGNDWRAMEAAAHAYAARSGTYRPLSTIGRDADGTIVARLEMPMPLGIVGGSTRHHRLAAALLRSLGIERASELAELAGAVGLAQNIAALRALSTEGIQVGHMRLHRRRGEV